MLGRSQFVEKFVWSSLIGCRELAGRMSRSSSIGCRELTESSPEECWKFIGSSPKEIGSSPGVHRKDVGVCRRDDWTSEIVC
ncbi:hypothetical protein BHM03_00025792 [Ensete ventricosum]|nr:hypothetical protein BHM03_00025792 [Ensete ventricosum]